MSKKSATYINWIAWRHLVSKKHKVGLSFMTTISIIGVAVGVAALVIVLSVMGGLENDLKQKMFKGLPHLELMAENAVAGFSLKQHPIKKFKSVYKEAVAIEPFIQSDVVLKNRKNLSPATLYGIDPQLGGKLWGFGHGLIQGNMDSLTKTHRSKLSDNANETFPGIIIGEDLAIQLNVDVGEEVTILNPQTGIRAAQGEISSNQFTTTFVVSGIFRTDIPQFDSKYAVVSLLQGRKFMVDYDQSLDEEEYVSGVAVNLHDPEDVEKFEARSVEFKGLKTLSWRIVNKSLLFALALEKFTMGAILLLIVVVAAFSISGTIMMTVFHKRGQVALLKSLGMTKKQVAKLFIIHGAAIGTIGIIVGMSFGLGVCAFLDSMQSANFTAKLYFQTKLPVKYLPVEYVVIASCAWLLSTLAAVYPAYVASNQDPSVGLRYV